MNNITGFIQPNMYAQPLMPMMQQPMGIISAGGGSDITTMVMVSVMVVVILFIIYRHMSTSNIYEEESEMFRYKREPFQDIDSLEKCGWEVYVSPSCPYCVRQKAILVEHFPNFKSMYTDKPAEVVPTWYNTKTKETKLGMQTLESLKNMVKC